MTSIVPTYRRWHLGALGGLGCLILGVGLYLNGFASGYWFPIGATGIVSVGTALTIMYADQQCHVQTAKGTAVGIGIGGLLLLWGTTVFYVVYDHLPVLISGMGLLGVSALICSHTWTIRYSGSTKGNLLLTLIHSSSLAVLAAILLNMPFIVRTALIGVNVILVVVFSAVRSQSDTSLARKREPAE